MNRTKRKYIDLSLVCGLIACLLLSVTGFAGSCEEMYDNIIRIRIIANSDSDEDQALKLAIRDAVLEKSKSIFSGAESYEDALDCAVENIEVFRRTAEQVIAASGSSYPVTLAVRDEYFNTREYDDFTLPAGKYTSLVFTVGKGQGQNWWCVMYPEVCVGACAGELTDSLSEDAADCAYNSEKYVVKFKAVEVFQALKKFLTENEK